MTDLERRALLGDRQAQEECTRLGIVLGCPCCKGKALEGKDCDDEGYYWWPVIYCESCFLEVSGDEVIGSKNAVVTDELRSRWNTRPAPTIGRCKDCANKEKATVNAKGFLICPASGMEITDDDFCSYFEPKGENENEV